MNTLSCTVQVSFHFYVMKVSDKKQKKKNSHHKNGHSYITIFYQRKVSSLFETFDDDYARDPLRNLSPSKIMHDFSSFHALLL